MLTSSFFESATILLREGLEALLVLAALAAYLTKVGAHNKLSALYAGAGGAVLASIAAAWVLERFYGGVHNDRMEGTVILLSAGLMFYVSGWLFLKQDPRAWQAYLKSHTDRVVEGGTLYAVATLAFLAVFREGAETVLLLHAPAKTAGWGAGMIGGIVAASLILAGCFVVINYCATRWLPLRAVFLISSGFLFLMGVKFIGAGLQEFQEQAVVPMHVASISDTLLWLGLNPSWEAVGLQLAVLALAGAGIWWSTVGKPAKTVAGE